MPTQQPTVSTPLTPLPRPSHHRTAWTKCFVIKRDRSFKLYTEHSSRFLLGAVLVDGEFRIAQHASFLRVGRRRSLPISVKGLHSLRARLVLPSCSLSNPWSRVDHLRFSRPALSSQSSEGSPGGHPTRSFRSRARTATRGWGGTRASPSRRPWDCRHSAPRPGAAAAAGPLSPPPLGAGRASLPWTPQPQWLQRRPGL